jgi:selenide,water dikinase
VYRITPDIAIVQTVDFFTPIVDDARDWGRITAANALSDVYAMGARPLTALSVVGWPRDTLPFELLGDVVEGGAEVLAAAGCTLVGGHSIDDPEPKYGLAVTGLVHPERVVGNDGARPGDDLVLTKPIGTGIVATAIKHGAADPATRDAAVASMVSLNDTAAEAMVRVGVHAATDVTGFGLLGHLHEMTAGGVAAEIDAGAVPLLPGAAELAAAGEIPGGTRRNLAAIAGLTEFGGADDVTRLLLADAQTSGGLLIALDPADTPDLIGAVAGAVVIGRFLEAAGPAVSVVGS